MAVCPKCGEEIEALTFHAKRVICGTFEVGCAYQVEDASKDLLYSEFSCPECDEILFTDEERANDFLLEN